MLWLVAQVVAAATTWAVAIQEARGATWLQTNTVGHSAPIMRVAADAARDVVVTVSDDKTARVWALSDGRAIATLRPPVGPARVGRLFAVALHPHDNVVAVAGSGSAAVAQGPSIWLFSTSNGQFVNRLDARGEHVRRLRWSSDGRLLLACFAEPGALRAFEVATGRMVYEETFGGDCLATAVRGERIAIGARDGSVAIYRAEPSALVPLARFRAAGDILSLDFSPDARRLAIGFYTVGLGAAIVSAETGAVEHALRTSLDVQQPGPVQPVSMTQAVLWSSDGRAVTTAGMTDHRPRVEGRIQRFDAATGRLLHSSAVAEDTILDLAPATISGKDALAGEAVVWASFAGTWGVFTAHTGSEPVATVRSRPEINFLIRQGARELLVSPDARIVRWAQGVERVPISFEVGARRVGAGRTDGLVTPRTRRGIVDAAQDFENHFHPRVRGQAIALRVGEVSRALTYVGDDGDVVLATSEGLRRLDRSLRVAWDVRTATEVRAVNATPDGRLIVTTMSDGTVRWWRARDGELLLSALVMRDGWVLWMPSGHYDASHGVESRVGWLIDRTDGPLPDFFTVGRFRDRFYRPDVIDRVLETADTGLAIQQADAARAASAPGATASAPLQSPAPPNTPAPTIGTGAAVDQIQAPVDLQTPPVLTPVESLRLDDRGTGPVTLRFALRLGRAPGSVQLEARLDGRLVDPTSVRLPVTLDGQQAGEISLTVGSEIHVVQLVARAGELASEPVRFQVDRSGVRSLEPSGPTGTLFLVSIGISKYAEPSIRLQMPAKDAVDFVEVMKRQRGQLYEAVEATILLDAQATRPAIEGAMRWLREKVKAGDIGVIFVAGHGTNNSKGEYHFVPYEFELSRPDDTTVPGRVFSDALTHLRGRPLLFLDTCFAGGVLGGATVQTAGFANAISAPENSVIVFASSTDKQESLERRSWGNGAFTKVLVLGLNGAASLPSTPAVTTRSLRPFVLDGVNRLTEGQQSPVAIIPDAVPERILSVPQRGP